MGKIGDERKSKPESALDGMQQQPNDEEKKLDNNNYEKDGEEVNHLPSLRNGDGKVLIPKDSTMNKEPVASNDSTNKDAAIDEVMKELRRVKRQNHITHCLLSVMIVVTTFWQLGELTAILTVKEKISHPLRAVRNFVLRRIGRDEVKIETAPLPPVQVPELPHVDLPTFTLNGRRESSGQERGW